MNDSMQQDQGTDIGSPTQPRHTKSTPDCPAWCTVPGDKHETEAHEKIGSWYAHRRTVLDTAYAEVSMSAIQMFEEQVRPGDAAEADPAIWVEILEDEPLSPKRAARLAKALLVAVELTR